MAAPTFGAAGTPVAELDSSIDVPYPAGISANDILVIAALTDSTVEIDTPPDFTAGDGRTQGAGLRAEWFWKRATGSESGSVTVTRTSGTVLFYAVMFRIASAITTGTPYDVNAQTGLGANATWTPADLDPVDAQDRLMVVIACAGEDLLTAGNYTGGTATVTERVDVETGTGGDATIHVADATHSAATAFDFGAQTTALSHAHCLFTIGFLPAAGGATVSPGSIVRTRALGTPTVNPKLAPASIVRTRALGSPTVNPTVALGSIVRSRALGAPTVTGAGTVAPASIVRTRALGSIVVSSTVVVVPDASGPRPRRVGRRRVG